MTAAVEGVIADEAALAGDQTQQGASRIMGALGGAWGHPRTPQSVLKSRTDSKQHRRLNAGHL
jgi:hypothetical protein